MPRWPPRCTPAGTSSCAPSARTSTTSGPAPTSSSTATPALQQAMRFALFPVVQAAARAEGRAIPAKGLTGRGYDGHSFWDMETYTLPVLTYVAPTAARDALLWRHSTLDMARARARELRIGGATFPWRTISRQGVLGLLARRHGGVPHQRRHRRRRAALHRARPATRSSSAARRRAARRDRPAVALARPPRRRRATSASTASPGRTSTRRSPTTTSTRTSWRPATCAPRPTSARHHGKRAAELGVDEEEIAAWRDAAAAMVIPFDEELGVTAAVARASPATATGTSLARRPSSTRCCCTTRTTRCTPARSSSRPTSSSRSTRAATHFSAEQKPRDFDYYEAITVRDSSLSACDPGDRRGRGRPPRPRLRLPRRDGLHRPARPRRQHEGRHPPRRAGGHVARRRRRLRRDARPRRHAAVRAAPARRARRG